MLRPIRLILAAAVLPLAGASTVALATGAAHPVPALMSCRGARLVRPVADVVLSCADANAQIKATHWSSWTSTTATGTTDFAVNLCDPTCVASRMLVFHGATIELRDPIETSGGRVFSRGVIRYTLRGQRRTFTAYPRT